MEQGVQQPTHDIAHLLSYQQLTDLEAIAEARGRSVEEIAIEAVDRYVMRESDQNN